MRILVRPYRKVQPYSSSAIAPSVSEQQPERHDVPLDQTTILVSDKKGLVMKTSFVGTIGSMELVEEATEMLAAAGFNVRRLSIIGPDLSENGNQHDDASTKTPNFWGKGGQLSNGYWGLMHGKSGFAINGAGPLRVAGPLATLVESCFRKYSRMGGTSLLTSIFSVVGIRPQVASSCEESLRLGKYLLILYGYADEVAGAEQQLKTLLSTEE